MWETGLKQERGQSQESGPRSEMIRKHSRYQRSGVKSRVRSENRFIHRVWSKNQSLESFSLKVGKQSEGREMNRK